MLYPQRVHRFVLELPGHNAVALFMALHQPGDEFCRRAEQGWIAGRLDASTFWEGTGQMVSGDKELGVAEGFQRPQAQDNLLSGLLGAVHLPIQLVNLKS